MSDFKEILDKAIAAEMRAQDAWVESMVRGILERTGIPITDLQLVRSRDARTVQIRYVPTNTVLAERVLVFKDAQETF